MIPILQSMGFTISIHAPARGATSIFCSAFHKLQYFNPRSREGSDENYIHAFSLYLHFNPRSREGSDYALYDDVSDHVLFQSTLPRGERRLQKLYATLYRHFNPRSREGSDTTVLPGRPKPFIFQSTLPRGERRQNSSGIATAVVFQSTLPRGERHYRRQYPQGSHPISIHAPARGAT